VAVTLDKPLKRELAIGQEPYMLTIAPDGLRLVPKGKRNGVELRWEDLVSGQAALAVALNASIERLARRDRRPATGNQARAAPATSGRAAEPPEAPSVRRGRSKSSASPAPRPRTRRRG
jgi:hypothetical protein